jgi:hypothetical protein
MTMPASRSPRGSMSPRNTASSPVSSLPKPVRCSAEVAASASRPVRVRLANVPTTAADVCTLKPCVRYSTANMIAADPTIAINSGGLPTAMAGRMNASRMAKLTPSPISAVRPCQRPKATVTSAKMPISTASWSPRRWSSTAYRVGPPGLLLSATMILSPADTTGWPEPSGIVAVTVCPACGPLVSRTVAVPHWRTAGCWQGVGCTAVTVASRRGG